MTKNAPYEQWVTRFCGSGEDILSRPEECVQIIVDTLFEIKMQKYEDSIETELIKRDQESN